VSSVYDPTQLLAPPKYRSTSNDIIIAAQPARKAQRRPTGNFLELIDKQLRAVPGPKCAISGLFNCRRCSYERKELGPGWASTAAATGENSASDCIVINRSSADGNLRMPQIAIEVKKNYWPTTTVIQMKA
jgi:hypothetical protein